MTTTKIFLIRHGKSKGNVEKRFQGWDDTPLSELGIEQAELVRSVLANERIDLVFYSPLLRAKQTAEIAFKERNITLVEEKGLIERNFGKLDGMSLEEIKQEHPEAEEFYHGRTTEIEGFDVEPIEQLKKRSFETLEKLVQQNKGKTIALTGHLFWIKSLLSTLLKKPYKEIAENYSVKNASITTITVTDNDFFVKKIGDKSHLASIQK